MTLASTNQNLIGMLDPQAQMSINPSGTYQARTSQGTTATAQPAYVSPGVTHASADVANPFVQAQYTMMERQLANAAAATGGGGGGGGGYTAPPPIVQPPIIDPPVIDPPVVTPPEGPGGAGGDGSGDLLGQFTDQEIGAALAALEAQYGMTREQLLQDQTLIGSQYRLLMARLNRQRQLGAEAVTSDAVSRGIYRSGIHGENLLEVENQSMEQIRDAEAQRLHSEQGIQTQLSYLDAQKAAEGAGIEAGLRREQGNYHLAAGVPMPSQSSGGGGAVAPQFQTMGYGAPAGGFAPAGAPAGAGDGSNAYAQSLFNQLLSGLGGVGASSVAGAGHQGTNIPFTALTTAATSPDRLAEYYRLFGSGASLNRNARSSALGQLGDSRTGGTVGTVEEFLSRLTPAQLAALGPQGIANVQNWSAVDPQGLVAILGRVNAQIAAGG